MWQIIKRVLKDNRVALMIYIGASLLFAWMYVGMFPSISKQAEQFMKAIESYPKEIMEAMGVEMTQASFTNLQSFLSMENFSMLWPIIVIAMTISLASNAIAGEIEKGTMAILLSQPISRVRLFLSKYLAAVCSISIFVVLSIFIIIPLALLQGASIQVKGFFMLAILGWLLAMAIYSVAMMLSAIFSEKGKVVFISIAMIVAMYALNVIAALKDSLDNLKYLSFFYHFSQQKAFVRSELDLVSVAVFAGVIVVSTIIGLYVFQKRDIAV